jgi:hypothetical protein
VVSTADPYGRNLDFLDRSRYCFSQVAEWTPFQTHYYSENLLVPGIEPGTSESVARKSDHYITEAVLSCVHHDLNMVLGNKVGKDEAVILALDIDSNNVILSHCKSFTIYEEPRAMTEDLISCDFTPRMTL